MGGSETMDWESWHLYIYKNDNTDETLDVHVARPGEPHDYNVVANALKLERDTADVWYMIRVEVIQIPNPEVWTM